MGIALLAISLALQAAAAILVGCFVWQTRRSGWLVISIGLTLLAVARARTLVKVLTEGVEVNLTAEAIVALVSLLSLVGLWLLKPGLPEPARPLKDAFQDAATHRLGARLAIVLGLLAAAGGTGAGYAAFVISRNSMVTTLLDSRLQDARTLARSMDQIAAQGSADDPLRAVAQAHSIWDSIPKRIEGSCLCIIDSHGRLMLHTQNPGMIGRDMGGTALGAGGGNASGAREPRLVRDLLTLRSDWRGRMLCCSEQEQLAAFAYCDSLRGLLVVHTPASAIDREILASALPWCGALAVILGVLLPLAMVLLFRAYNASQAELTRTNEELIESEARFRVMADYAPVMIWMSSVEGKSEYFNLGWLSFRGRTLDQEQNNGWLQGIHLDDQDPSVKAYMSAFQERKAFRMEYRIRRSDGEYRWMLDSGRPRFLTDGGFAGYIGTCVDITEHRQHADELHAAAEQHKLLLSEMNHRVRNNLAALLTLVDLSASSAKDIPQFAAAIRGRVEAMGKVHSMLSRGQWRSLNLGAILDALILGERIRQVTVSGPTILVPAPQATALGMVIQELFANSLKYGALSTTAGRVIVTWIMLDSTERNTERLELLWTERHGPPIPSPREPGVGTSLIEGLVRSELRGQAELNYPPEGATHRLVVVLSTGPQPAAPLRQFALALDDRSN